jgi:hypothetical protein
MLAVAGALQACGDSAADTVTDGDGDGAGAGGVRGDGGASAPNAGTNNSSAGSAAEGGGVEAGAGAPGNVGAPGNAGAPANAGGAGGVSGDADGGTGGSGASGTCHISWTGAETGAAGCPRLHVCQRSFLSLNLDEPDPPTPLKSIQLVYSPDHDLSLGTFVATGRDVVNCNVQTPDGDVSYAPQLDENSMLTGGTSLTVTLTALSFSTDPKDVCSGTAHGSLDAVLPPTNAPAGAQSLALHAEF